jgi:HAMP domain-containing protein
MVGLLNEAGRQVDRLRANRRPDQYGAITEVYALAGAVSR